MPLAFWPGLLRSTEGGGERLAFSKKQIRHCLIVKSAAPARLNICANSIADHAPVRASRCRHPGGGGGGGERDGRTAGVDAAHFTRGAAVGAQVSGGQQQRPDNEGSCPRERRREKMGAACRNERLSCTCVCAVIARRCFVMMMCVHW